MKTKEPQGLKVREKARMFILLAALCFLVYANSLNNAFVSDDIPAILNNPDIAKPFSYWLNPASFLNSLNYLVSGVNPFIYHLTNIILHSLNTILVFSFLLLFFKTDASLLGAVLFAVHPIHSEAVAWVSGRPYIITSLFILIVYLLYYSVSQAASKGGKINLTRYLASIVIFTYYLANNFSFYFVFPLFLILSDVTFKHWKRAWKLWIPFLVIVILRVILARNVISERISFVAGEMGQEVVRTNPLFNLAYSFFSHMGLLLWPAKLTLYHEPAVISPFALKAELFFLALIAISLPFIFKKAKELFFGLGIFVLFLTPSYSPVMVSWLVAERYLYFPSIFLSISLAFFYEKYLRREQDARGANMGLPGIPLTVVLLVIAGFAVRAVARNEDWKTPGRFWRQTALVSSDSPRSHNNMGDAYCQEGNIAGGIREFKKAIELKPDYADAYHNLGNIYQSAGDLKEAARLYQQAVYYNPGLFESYYNLGIIYLGTGELDSAKSALERALQIRPENQNAMEALDMATKKGARR